MDYVTGPPPCPGFKITLGDEVCAKDPVCGTKRGSSFIKQRKFKIWSCETNLTKSSGQTMEPHSVPSIC